MPTNTKTVKTKKRLHVRDLKPAKDPKGGDIETPTTIGSGSSGAGAGKTKWGEFTLRP